MSKHFGRKKLRRLPQKGKLGGVCAGIADYLGLESWVVRLIVIGAAIWTSFAPIIFLYVFALFLLDEGEPSDEYQTASYAYEGGAEKKNERDRHKIPAREVWRTAPSVDAQVDKLKAKFADLEKHVRQVESCVTTQEFQLRRKFKNL